MCCSFASAEPILLLCLCMLRILAFLWFSALDRMLVLHLSFDLHHEIYSHCLSSGRLNEHASIHIQDVRFLFGNLSQTRGYIHRSEFSNAYLRTEWHSFLHESLRAKASNGGYQRCAGSRFLTGKRVSLRQHSKSNQSHDGCLVVLGRRTIGLYSPTGWQ